MQLNSSLQVQFVPMHVTSGYQNNIQSHFFSFHRDNSFCFGGILTHYKVFDLETCSYLNLLIEHLLLQMTIPVDFFCENLPVTKEEIRKIKSSSPKSFILDPIPTPLLLTHLEVSRLLSRTSSMSLFNKE